MDSSLASTFAAACGADAPLDLVVEHADGPVVASGELAQPFAVLGRDPECDVHLNDPTVCSRHAFLQVIAGQVFIADLNSRGGLAWADGYHPFGWLVPGQPVTVGPFRVYLTRPVSARPVPLDPDFHPLTGGRLPTGLRPAQLEFRSGKADRTAWEVNRAVTLVGRARACKLQLTGDDISPFHCYLVRAADGLWAVDLLSRTGTRVDGQPVRAARLEHDSELEVGGFRLGCAYPQPPDDADSGDGLVSFEVPDKRTESAQLLLSATPPELRSAGARLHGSTMTAPPGAVLGETPPPRAGGPVVPLTAADGPLARFDRAVAGLPEEYWPAFAAVRADLTRRLAERPPEPPVPLTPVVPPAVAADCQWDVWEKIAKLDEEKGGGWKKLFGLR